MEKRIEYKMVDLGLPSGLKWADRNVGATKPEEYGDYFMWGSTTPDTNKPCDWAHAPFNNGSKKFDESYFNEHKSEWLTDKDVLKPEYDAATQIMSGSWRMPASEEMQELVDGTTQTVEEVNGVKGVRFTSNANGNSIFMPLAGGRYGSAVINVDKEGCAWTATLLAGCAGNSHCLCFRYSGNAYVSSYYHYSGFAVRGVHE